MKYMQLFEYGILLMIKFFNELAMICLADNIVIILPIKNVSLIFFYFITEENRPF